jgi:hypothetical protein
MESNHKILLLCLINIFAQRKFSGIQRNKKGSRKSCLFISDRIEPKNYLYSSEKFSITDFLGRAE